MRILITGDRHWRCDDLAEQIINRLLARYGPDLVIVHGGAPGVDNAFATACREVGIVADHHACEFDPDLAKSFRSHPLSS
jgi:acetylglutamate kinase